LSYKLRWDIESFFAWWKHHLKAYHLFTRSENGMMVQIPSGLMTYLLLAIYCHEEDGEHVSIRRRRQLRIQSRNETIQQAEELAVELTVVKQKQKQKRRGEPKLRKRLKNALTTFQPDTPGFSVRMPP